MKEAAETITKILNELKTMAVPGTNLLDIEKRAEELTKKYKVKPFNKGYHPKWAPNPYPAVTCLGFNNVITHGIPISYVIQDGDLISIDLSIVQGGKCADAGLTLGVGNIDNRKGRLLHYAYQTTEYAISLLQPGASTEDIAWAIKRYANSRGYRINRRFAGHRIGAKMHLKPNIYNTPEDIYEYGTIEVGQVYCVEPFLTPGKDELGISPNGWTYITADGQPSAFFEHMVLITKNGPEILTGHIEKPIWH